MDPNTLWKKGGEDKERGVERRERIEPTHVRKCSGLGRGDRKKNSMPAQKDVTIGGH